MTEMQYDWLELSQQHLDDELATTIANSFDTLMISLSQMRNLPADREKRVGDLWMAKSLVLQTMPTALVFQIPKESTP